MDKDKKIAPQADDEMMHKILEHNCGNRETDEFAADELELAYFHKNRPTDEEEFAQDEGIGESKYFSTCEFTMINDEDDLINSQGS